MSEETKENAESTQKNLGYAAYYLGVAKARASGVGDKKLTEKVDKAITATEEAAAHVGKALDNT